MNRRDFLQGLSSTLASLGLSHMVELTVPPETQQKILEAEIPVKVFVNDIFIGWAKDFRLELNCQVEEVTSARGYPLANRRVNEEVLVKIKLDQEGRP